MKRAANKAAIAFIPCSQRDELILTHLDLVERNVHSIRRMIDRRAAVDEEDLRGAATLKLVEQSERFDAAVAGDAPREKLSAFAAYARKAVRGAAWDQARRRKLRDCSHGPLNERAYQFPDASPSPRERCAARERRELLNDALATLEPVERFLVEGYYNESGNLAKLGKACGLDRKQASRVHVRALAKMQHYMHLRGLWEPCAA